MTQSVQTAALAKQDNSAAGMVKSYSDYLTQVMPTHMKPEAWLRIATGALRKGKKVERGDYAGAFELEVAAINNPAAFIAALLDAARLGLEPGTEQFYLTPRSVKGQLEILGIVGYQGIVELMYRAGAISSVIAEVVYSHDKFTYQPGRDEIPGHEIDWDSDDRGQLRLVYAYAKMKDGSFSKVVVMNKAAIARVKASSQGANSEYSPWVKHEPAMWLKSAVRQLAKWVPTSAEIRGHDAPKPVPAIATLTQSEAPARSPGDIMDNEVADAEFIPEDEPDYDPRTGEVIPDGVGVR